MEAQDMLGVRMRNPTRIFVPNFSRWITARSIRAFAMTKEIRAGLSLVLKWRGRQPEYLFSNYASADLYAISALASCANNKKLDVQTVAIWQVARHGLARASDVLVKYWRAKNARSPVIALVHCHSKNIRTFGGRLGTTSKNADKKLFF
jgi:hypothetical protein